MGFISLFVPNSIKKAKELEKYSTHNFQVEVNNAMEEVYDLAQYHEKSLKEIENNLNNNLLIMTIFKNQRPDK